MGAPDSKRTKSLLRFGQFILDLERHALYRGQEHVHLTGKPFETLLFLVQNRGQTVKKETLLDAVWKDLFVTENTLEHAVSEIRRALGDDKEDPDFIQTVPRQGYRFVGSVVSQIDGEHLWKRSTDAQRLRNDSHREAPVISLSSQIPAKVEPQI